MVIVGLMVSAFGIFLILNQGIESTFEMVDGDISDQRVMIEHVDDVSTATVSGASIMYHLHEGIAMPIQVEGVIYEVGETYETVSISRDAQYRMTYVFDTDGTVIRVVYERVLS